MSITVSTDSHARRSTPQRGTTQLLTRGLLLVSPLLFATVLESVGLLRNIPFLFQSVLLLTNLVLLGGVWFYARRHSGNTLYGWAITAVSLTAITVSISLWVWTYFTSTPLPFTGVLEFLYLSSAVLLWPAMIFLRQADRRPGHFNIRTAIDVVVTVVSIATLVWYFILVPFAPETMSVSLLGSDFLIPAVRLIMLSVAAYTFLQTSARQPSHLYATGIVLLIAADLGLTFIVHEATEMNLITPLIWSAGMFALFIDVQRKPRLSHMHAPALPLPTANGVPYVMATLAIATLLLGDDLLRLNRIANAQAYLIGLGLLALLLTRQMISLRDNRLLIRSLVRTNRELYKKATTDHLTGLFNRGAFTRRLQEFVDGEIAGCLLFIDVNHFKAVNDTYGHAVGDALLQSVANRITHRLVDSWIASRAGGDEFMAALPGADPEVAERFAADLQTALELPHYINSDQHISITVAIGAAHYPFDGRDLDTIIDTADQRMYKIKRAMKAAAETK